MTSPATVFVLFGATGDLARRLVLPAFAALAQADLLPQEWRLVGNGRGDLTDEDFREHVADVLSEQIGDTLDEDVWKAMAANLRFAGGGFTSDDPGKLPGVLSDVRQDVGEDAQVIHYLALPPSTFESYTQALADHHIAEGTRVVYEKPYGTSAQSFESLDSLALSIFDEEQVFRIDHFLGKEATQQLHVLRFVNRLFEQVWNRDNVAAVQIDVPEELDVADRAAFYDETGATLDMLVTHLLQVAAEVALEPPAGPSAQALQDARESVLAAFRPIEPSDVVLGQVEGYLDLPEVADDSTTDTYVAARVWVDTERWRDVPFLLRTGKQLAQSHQQVTLVMRRAESDVYGAPPRPECLTFTLSGSGAVTAAITAQQPGSPGDLVPGGLCLDLEALPKAEPLPAYASLLRDVLAGDRALFTSSQGLRDAWRIVGRLLADRPAVHTYEPGSWGPPQAGALAAPYGWLLGGDGAADA